MKLVIALTAVLLPTLAAAAEPDPVLLSFERDLVREPAVQAIRPAVAREDALEDAIQAALYGTEGAGKLANSAGHPAARACRGG